MKHIADAAKESPLTPAALRAWREGYRTYLESKGLPPESAADMAAKIAYRPDLYPVPGEAIALPQLTALALSKQAAAVESVPAAPAIDSKKEGTLPALADDAKHEELTKRQRMLIEEAMALELEQAKSAGATGYYARFLVQATLPHADPKTNYFERGTDKLTLSITANPRHGVPYGGLPRLLLAWMCTEAVMTDSPALSLGRSQAEFLRKLDLHNDGHYIGRLRDQSLRLVRSLIAVSGQDGDAFELENILIAKKAFIFWSTKTSDQPALWDSSITLSQDFFDALKKAPVPIKMEALRALKKSPLAMDIYTWLVYRMFTLNVASRHGSKGAAHVPWTGLMTQLGANYANTPRGIENFRANFKKRLREALVFYPEARDHIQDTKEHLILTPAKLHIDPRLPRLQR